MRKNNLPGVDWVLTGTHIHAYLLSRHQGDTEMTITFNVGQTYSDRSICDHNCIFSFTILARTAKTVTVEVSGQTVKRGLSVYEGVEQFKPFGSYSMCSIVNANDPDLSAVVHPAFATEG